jgi:hypothetical protein
MKVGYFILEQNLKLTEIDVPLLTRKPCVFGELN